MMKNKKKKGFLQLFNCSGLTGREDNKHRYVVKNGNMICDPSLSGKGKLFTADDYGDFILRFKSHLSLFFETWGTIVCRAF